MLAPLAALTSGAASSAPGAVDAARLQAADSEPQNWFTGGRDKDGTYYSPLKMIDAGNVKDLGFAWGYDLGTPQRGQEATPIVIDGVLYTSGTWGYVYAVDAATGRELWRYDPKADYAAARNPCCDLVNRGVAVWQGKVYVASVDGRLHALDAATGKKIWVVDTITNHKLPYSSTGAPQIAGDVVVIGNSGSDMGRVGVRGYVAAYDLQTGAFKWRFYTVPPAPGQPFENPELEAAAKTWDAQRDPRYQGGGTVWDGMAYDRALNLVYFGTGNAAPYDLRQLGPAKLDGLYTASIVALHADTGRLAWYYQTTPHDHWDFDANQKLIFADLDIDGVPTQVLLQASKNGFFYILERKTGKLLSAKNFTYINWASGVDMKTGRPVPTSQSDWYASPKTMYPSWAGGHTWNPMSFSPQTHLVYIPVLDVPSVWVDMLHNGGQVKFIDGFYHRQWHLSRRHLRCGGFEASVRTAAGPEGHPGDAQGQAGARTDSRLGSGRAENRVGARDLERHPRLRRRRDVDRGQSRVPRPRQRRTMGVRRRHRQGLEGDQDRQPHHGGPDNLFGRTANSMSRFRSAMAAPPSPRGPSRRAAQPTTYENTNRIIAFKLGGGEVPTPPARVSEPFAKPPAQTATAAAIDAGEIKFIEECTRCHALGLSTTPDLRRLNAGLHAAFKDIVLHGALAPAGMERFDDILSEKDVDNIHAYLIEQSWIAYRAQEAAAHR